MRLLLILFVLLAARPGLTADSVPVLVSPAQLQKVMPAAKVLQVLPPETARPENLIKGAMLTDYSKDGWVMDYDSLPGMLPPSGPFSRVLERFGLSPRDRVVLVPMGPGDQAMAVVTRIFWSLRVYGFERLHILEKGIEGWQSSGGAVASAAKKPMRGMLRVKPKNPHWIASYGDVYAGADYGTPVIDARDYGRAGGQAARHPLAGRSGKIFDAVIVPATSMMRKDASGFKTVEELRKHFSDVFGDPPGPIVVYSDTGLRASVAWFAIREIMGEKDVRLYDGSYLEWEAMGHEVFDETDGMGGPIGG